MTVAQPLGQLDDRGRLEHGADRQFDTQAGSHPAHQPGGQQRVPAQGEEMVVDPHLRQRQTLGEQVAEDLLLGLRGRDGIAPCARGPAGPCGRACRWGSAEGLQHDEGRRHHVLGQQRGEPARSAAGSGVSPVAGTT